MRIALAVILTLTPHTSALTPHPLTLALSLTLSLTLTLTLTLTLSLTLTLTLGGNLRSALSTCPDPFVLLRAECVHRFQNTRRYLSETSSPRCGTITPL